MVALSIIILAKAISISTNSTLGGAIPPERTKSDGLPASDTCDVVIIFFVVVRWILVCWLCFMIYASVDDIVGYIIL